MRPELIFNLVPRCLFHWLHKPLEWAGRTTFLAYNHIHIVHEYLDLAVYNQKQQKVG
jgi:hypothetical protein